MVERRTPSLSADAGPRMRLQLLRATDAALGAYGVRMAGIAVRAAGEQRRLDDGHVGGREDLKMETRTELGRLHRKADQGRREAEPGRQGPQAPPRQPGPRTLGVAG